MVSSLLAMSAIGCGGAANQPPVIQNLTYGPDKIALGKQTTISGNFTFTDDSGVLKELDASLQLPSGEVQAVPPTPIQGAPAQKSGTVTFSVTVAPLLAGRFRLDVWVVDGVGESNHLTGDVDVQ